MAENENKIASASADQKPVKAKKTSDKPGLFKRIGNWFKGLKSEFKKITWASKKATFKNFGIVLTIVIISAVVIGVIDIGLGAFFNFLLEVINF
ncbi:MAG: preprotein translocase subunit SecE [Ruminococcaceae bacterium]|nr:preprotein translocase subunit SecE [Oscillospiraceae bacterium]